MIYPIASINDWYGHCDFKTWGVMIEMSPKDFLTQCPKLVIDDESRESIEILKTHIMAGNTLDPLYLGPFPSHDGRHRAMAALELNIDRVPVIKPKHL